jgi:hypothetical protein
VHTEISLHELEIAILDALKPLPLKLNERAVDFLIKKKHLSEAAVLGCLKHHYQEHPDELKGCRPVPKSTLQMLVSLAAQGLLPAVPEVPWWEQMVEAEEIAARVKFDELKEFGGGCAACA